MNKRKQFLSVLLAGMMIVPATGCGQTPQNHSGDRRTDRGDQGCVSG